MKFYSMVVLSVMVITQTLGMRNEVMCLLIKPKANGETRKWRVACLKQKDNNKKCTNNLSKTKSSCNPSKMR